MRGFIGQVDSPHLICRGLPSEELRTGHEVAWNTYLPRLAIAAAGGDPGSDPHA